MFTVLAHDLQMQPLSIVHDVNPIQPFTASGTAVFPACISHVIQCYCQ
jgi:hypothetical protein